jgi:hypothetical protein
LNTHCSLATSDSYKTLSAHPIGKTLERKTREWKQMPSTQYGDIRRQYSNYNKINTKMILIIINTITQMSKSCLNIVPMKVLCFILYDGVVYRKITKFQVLASVSYRNMIAAIVFIIDHILCRTVNIWTFSPFSYYVKFFLQLCHHFTFTWIVTTTEVC